MSTEDRKSRAAAVLARQSKPVGVTAIQAKNRRTSVDLTAEEFGRFGVWLAQQTQETGRSFDKRAVFRALLAEMLEVDDAGDLMPDARALQDRVRARLAREA